MGGRESQKASKQEGSQQGREGWGQSRDKDNQPSFQLVSVVTLIPKMLLHRQSAQVTGTESVVTLAMGTSKGKHCTCPGPPPGTLRLRVSVAPSVKREPVAPQISPHDLLTLPLTPTPISAFPRCTEMPRIPTLLLSEFEIKCFQVTKQHKIQGQKRGDRRSSRVQVCPPK